MKNQKEKIYIPYHVNPAVIKSYLMRLPKDQLILHARYIRRRVAQEEPGSTKRFMFVRLYQFCAQLYRSKFK